MNQLLSAEETAARLPYAALVTQIGEVLADPLVQVPERLVQALPEGCSLLVMPAFDGRIAITKLITFTPRSSAGGTRPSAGRCFSRAAAGQAGTWPPRGRL